MADDTCLGAAQESDKGPACEERGPKQVGPLHARKALVIGLTGGIATGKTTVAGMLKDLGARIISADDLIHDMLQPKSVIWSAVVEKFGEGILAPNGQIDRGKLADIVFEDEEKKKSLEAITHPPVIKHLTNEAKRFRKEGEGILVLEVPLLIEAGCLGIVDKILVVSAEQETQIERLEKRYGIGREEAILRIRSQLPLSEKLKYADWVVNTEGTLEGTKKQVDKVWRSSQKSLAIPDCAML